MVADLPGAADIEGLRSAASTPPVEGGRWISNRELRFRMIGAVALALAAVAGTLMVGWLQVDQRQRFDTDAEATAATSACRSGLAAEVDVAAGTLNIAVAHLVDVLATGSPEATASAVAELRPAADALEDALVARGQTLELCG